MSKAPKTMDAALAIASQYEHLHAHARLIVDVNAMSFRNRNNRRSSSGSRRFNTNPPSSDKPSCSYCHKRGHHINDCFSRQKATNSSQYNSGSCQNSMSKRKFRGMHRIQTNNSDQLLRVQLMKKQIARMEMNPGVTIMKKVVIFHRSIVMMENQIFKNQKKVLRNQLTHLLFPKYQTVINRKFYRNQRLLNQQEAHLTQEHNI